MRSIHAGERVACEFSGCIATFMDNGSMKRHMRSIHAGERVVSGAEHSSSSSGMDADVHFVAGNKRRQSEAFPVAI